MKGTTLLVMCATVSLLACGKTETADTSTAATETPPQAAPVTLAPEALPAETPPAVAAPEIAADATPAAPVSPPPVQAKAQPTPPPPVKAPAPPASTPKAPAAAPASAPLPSVAKPDLAHGQQIYRQACAFCHDKGIAGAPKLGDTTAWAPRLAQGMDTLYGNAIRGKGAMPAKGGTPSLADADVKAAVDFMTEQAR
jgi:cytochrome c5